MSEDQDVATSDSGQRIGPVTLDQLVALNDEMAALVRAGIPLERGLIDAGHDLGGRLGRVVAGLGERLDRGERLSEALAVSRGGLPRVYASVVEAGIRSGRLAKALEGMAMIARGHADARRAVGLSLLYPILVLILAYALVVLFAVEIAPKFVDGFEGLGLRPVGPLIALAHLGLSARYWGPVLPAALLMLGFLWTIAGRARSLDGGPAMSIARRMPMVGRMVRDFRSANFADLLALLIEHRVPLDEAVRLAGEASGDRALAVAAGTLADRIRIEDRGEATAPDARSSIPPLLSWMLDAGQRQGNLPEALRQAGSTYRRRAEIRAELLRSVLPAFFLIVIGAVAAFAYGLVLFLPLIALWDDLAIPSN